MPQTGLRQPPRRNKAETKGSSPHLAEGRPFAALPLRHLPAAEGRAEPHGLKLLPAGPHRPPPRPRPSPSPEPPSPGPPGAVRAAPRPRCRPRPLRHYPLPSQGAASSLRMRKGCAPAPALLLALPSPPRPSPLATPRRPSPPPAAIGREALATPPSPAACRWRFLAPPPLGFGKKAGSGFYLRRGKWRPTVAPCHQCPFQCGNKTEKKPQKSTKCTKKAQSV